MLGLLNTVLTRGGSLLTYVKEGLVMANRFLTPPKLTFPVNGSAEFDGASDYQYPTKRAVQLYEPHHCGVGIAELLDVSTGRFGFIFDNRECN